MKSISNTIVMVMNNYQSKEYLEKIKSYLADMINDLKKSDK